MFVLKSKHEKEIADLESRIAGLRRLVDSQMNRHIQLLAHLGLAQIHEPAKPEGWRIVAAEEWAKEIAKKQEEDKQRQAFRESAQQNGMNFGFYQQGRP